jgi:hypothetical protein
MLYLLGLMIPLTLWRTVMSCFLLGKMWSAFPIDWGAKKKIITWKISSVTLGLAYASMKR